MTACITCTTPHRTELTMRSSVIRSVALLLLVSTSLVAQDSTRTPQESAAEERARLARRAAGMTIGPWQLRGAEPPSGVDVSTLPMMSGFMRKGLDARLALENGIGVWRRVQSVPATGGIGGT